MRKRKLNITALLLLLLLFALQAEAAQKRIFILSVNDPHSNILAMREAPAAGLGPEAPIIRSGGLEYALSLIDLEGKKLAAEGKAPVFLLEGGDMMLGRKGSLQNGRAEYGALALSGFDAGVLGNHDFDGGLSVLRALGPKLSLPVLASNIKFNDPKLEAFYPKTKIIEKNGVRLGLFGLITPDLKSLISEPSGFEVETELNKTAAECVAALRAQKVDLIVAINHIGLERDKKLAASVSGIAAIVGGHSHDAVADKLLVTAPDGSSVLIGQAGLDGRFIGRYELVTDEGQLVPEQSHWQLLAVTEKTPPQPAIAALGSALRKQTSEKLELADPVAFLPESVDGTKNAVRQKEAVLGDMTADAMKAALGTQTAVVNGGSLRIGKIVPAGLFTSLDLLDLLPFSDRLMKVYLTGAELRRQLELSASSLPSRKGGGKGLYNGEFLQVAGLAFDIDLNEKPAEAKGRLMTAPGSRVKRLRIEGKAGLEPLLDDRIYSVAAVEYTVRYWNTVLSQQTEVSQLSALNDWFGSFPGRRPVLPRLERINIIPEK